MEGAQHRFRRMLKDVVAPQLRTLGLKGSGHRFHLPDHYSRVVLDFQKSQGNTAEKVRFAVNLMVAPLDQWEATQASRRAGSIMWSARLGFLLPVRSDYWWTLADPTYRPYGGFFATRDGMPDHYVPVEDVETDERRIGAEVLRSIRDYGLPAVERAMVRQSSRADGSRSIETPSDGALLPPCDVLAARGVGEDYSTLDEFAARLREGGRAFYVRNGIWVSVQRWVDVPGADGRVHACVHSRNPDPSHRDAQEDVRAGLEALASLRRTDARFEDRFEEFGLAIEYVRDDGFFSGGLSGAKKLGDVGASGEVHWRRGLEPERQGGGGP